MATLTLTQIQIHSDLDRNTRVNVIVEQDLPCGKKAYESGELSWCKHQGVWEVYVSSFHSYYPEYESLPTRLYQLPK